MNKLAIVGSLAFDAIETPSGKTDKIIGGASPYIALASSYFGVKPQIISVVGGDFPKAYFHLLGGKGIDTTGVEVKADGKTMFWSGVYNKDMNQRTTLVTELNVFADFTPSVPESYKNPDVLMLGNITPSIQQAVIREIGARPKLIVMDTMNYWMNTTPDDLDATGGATALRRILAREGRPQNPRNGTPIPYYKEGRQWRIALRKRWADILCARTAVGDRCRPHRRRRQLCRRILRLYGGKRQHRLRDSQSSRSGWQRDGLVLLREVWHRESSIP